VREGGRGKVGERERGEIAAVLTDVRWLAELRVRGCKRRLGFVRLVGGGARGFWMDSLPRDWMSWLESKHGFPFGFCFSFEECKRRHDKMDSAEETDHWDSLDGLSMCWDVLYRKLVVPGPLLVGKLLKVTSRNWGALAKIHGSTSKNL